MSDPLEEREFQGLTIAIPFAKFDYIKQKMRALLDEVDDEYTSERSVDTVVRLQLCAFKVSRSDNSSK